MNEGRSRDQCCRRKAISSKHSECVFLALVIHHAKRMRHIIQSPAVCLVTPYFTHYLIIGTIFRGKSYWTGNVCFNFLCNFCL